jgi:hypothetical protein
MADTIKFGGVSLKVYDDSNYTELIGTKIDGVKMGTGLVPRSLELQPQGYSAAAPPAQIKLIPKSEYDARIKMQEETKSSLQHIRMTGNAGKMIPSLNQGSWGYCWAHGPVQSVHLVRAVMNQPYVPLSAFSVAGPLVNYRNEGGWGAMALERMRDVGVCSQALWPQGQSKASLDTPASRQNAALHKVVSDWADIASPHYDQNMTLEQCHTCLLNNEPVVYDLNWWGHSLVAIRLILIEPGRYGTLMWNSWGDEYEDHGMVVLSGSKATPDNAVALVSSVASEAV